MGAFSLPRYGSRGDLPRSTLGLTPGGRATRGTSKFDEPGVFTRFA